ncbi:hypothetical protein CTA1_6891 [Colletotrichum tanaceti]|uniref:Uncharacterized protein n=1 Tax=Colletotrichum tanaceti TaxID=1306861 RepID=A0A4U6XM75_9PEZI|nr:hypothetical protein CTA1_6891 [Colletotrichum tanaceti]
MKSLRDSWVSGFDRMIYGLNVMWLDFDSSDSRDSCGQDLRRGAPETAQPGSLSWMAAKVGKRGQASGWSCRILRRDDTLTARDTKREMMPSTQEKEYNKKTARHEKLR